MIYLVATLKFAFFNITHTVHKPHSSEFQFCSTSGGGCVLRHRWAASFTCCVDMSCTLGVATKNMFHSLEVLAV